jgi:hypothetical protein
LSSTKQIADPFISFHSTRFLFQILFQFHIVQDMRNKINQWCNFWTSRIWAVRWFDPHSPTFISFLPGFFTASLFSLVFLFHSLFYYYIFSISYQHMRLFALHVRLVLWSELMADKSSVCKRKCKLRRLNVTLPVIGDFISIVPRRGKEDWWVVARGSAASGWPSSSSGDSLSANQTRFSLSISSHQKSAASQYPHEQILLVLADEWEWEWVKGVKQEKVTQ